MARQGEGGQGHNTTITNGRLFNAILTKDNGAGAGLRCRWDGDHTTICIPLNDDHLREVYLPTAKVLDVYLDFDDIVNILPDILHKQYIHSSKGGNEAVRFLRALALDIKRSHATEED